MGGFVCVLCVRYSGHWSHSGGKTKEFGMSLVLKD